jgi:hypothetical protein
MLFKLLAGEHVGPDYDADPVDVTDPVSGKVTQKQPSRHYKAGEVINSGDFDLASKLGANKFELVSDRKSRKGKKAEAEEGNQAILPSFTAPHGQVSQGFQVASLNEELGTHGSRAMSDEEIREAGLAGNQPLTTRTGLRADSDKPGDKGKEEPKGGKKGEKEGKLKDRYFLDEMKKDELEEVAETEGVDISGCKTKAEILEELNKH